jgi:aconitate hydratase
VYLSDIWPDDFSIATLTQAANRPDDYAAAFTKACEISQWEHLAAPRTSTYDWDIRSTFLQPPPFCQRAKSRQLIDVAAPPLLVLGDDITTDHISPAGQIPPDSEAGRYLIECGDKPDALGVYAARRGNWQVMRRGLFTNPSLVNLLDKSLAPGKAIEPHTGEVMPLWRLAETAQTRDQTFAIFAGERYGMGSSRDWAAKGQYLIGVSIVFASSFERIHRANLVGMGIVPLRLAKSDHPTSLDLTSNDHVAIKIDLHTLTPDQQTVASIIRDGVVRRKLTVTVEVKTSAEISQLRAGGILPMILEQSCVS